MDYFIADPHFYDSLINILADRPFKDVDEMNSNIIKSWNKKVKPIDKVYLIGDVANFRNIEYGDKNNRMLLVKSIIEQLHGYKILIYGNHDNWLNEYEWKSVGFDEVIKYPIVYNGFLILSHEPMFMNNHTPFINIFGHVHSNPIYTDCSQHSYCVSVERINYTPISFEEMRENILKTINKQ